MRRLGQQGTVRPVEINTGMMGSSPAGRAGADYIYRGTIDMAASGIWLRDPAP
jgi:hypothetical protein